MSIRAFDRKVSGKQMLLMLVSLMVTTICGSNTATAEDSKATTNKSIAVSDKPASVIPVSRTDGGWMERHEKLVKAVRASHCKIAFFGDSITEGMNVELMHKIIGADSENFGIGGDRTQHLLWRMQNGELDFPGPGPKAFVVLIGTNNISKWPGNPSSTNQEILQGVDADIKEIESKFPKSKILLLGMLPREEQASHATRTRVNDTNTLLKTLADSKHVWYADISKELLEADGRLAPEVMGDFLHPTKQEGYTKMFNAIKPHLEKMMK